MATQILTRKQRGERILPQDIERLNELSFWVKSQSGKDGYSVTLYGGRWTCDCPDYRFRGMTCKHIFAAQSVQSKKPKEKFSLNLWR
jgi:hypothetical protein